MRLLIFLKRSVTLHNCYERGAGVDTLIQGNSSQTVRSNLTLREGKIDISNILWHLCSRKLQHILSAIDYMKYFSFFLSEPNYLLQFEMRYPVFWRVFPCSTTVLWILKSIWHDLSTISFFVFLNSWVRGLHFTTGTYKHKFTF